MRCEEDVRVFCKIEKRGLEISFVEYDLKMLRRLQRENDTFRKHDLTKNSKRK